jgi:CRISPR-associated protein Cas2
MLVLVIYDIPDNRRRQKLSDLLEGYGRRVQKSAFECFLTLPEMQTLYRQLHQRTKPSEDDVRLYWIPADAVPRSLAIGSLLPEPPPTVYIV